MNLIECDCCEVSFQDGFMWWSGRFWYCFECATRLEEEAC
jgi:hypothetical protein